MVGCCKLALGWIVMGRVLCVVVGCGWAPFGGDVFVYGGDAMGWALVCYGRWRWV